MEIDKKNVLDELYILKNALMEKSEQQSDAAIDNANDVCLNNLALGRRDGFQNSWIALDKVIRNIINM
jgi:hypothetical protein